MKAGIIEGFYDSEDFGENSDLDLKDNSLYQRLKAQPRSPNLGNVFLRMPTDKHKFLMLEPKALYAFAINNMRILKDDLREAMAAVSSKPTCRRIFIFADSALLKNDIMRTMKLDNPFQLFGYFGPEYSGD